MYTILPGVGPRREEARSPVTSKSLRSRRAKGAGAGAVLTLSAVELAGKGATMEY